MYEKYLYDETYALIGATYEVYNQIGYGVSEEIYQQSLEIELTFRKIPFASKKQLKTFYKGQQLEKIYIPDLFVYEEIIVELKSVKELLPEHEAQLLNYMRLTKSSIGYLINLGAKSGLVKKRYILSEFIKS